MKKFDLKIMAERLKMLRTEMGIGQNALADSVGVSNASISYWETGKQQPSAVSKLQQALPYRWS